MEIHVNPQHGSIEVSQGKELIFLKVAEIIFIEISDRKTFVHTRDKIYRSRLNLQECLKQLPDYFMQIGKSQIANIIEIASINKSLSSTPRITFHQSEKSTWVSRKYYKALLNKKRSLL
ncbi:LytTR family DNA-binding domain-containing protein [Streptococcus dentapri]|uniref:LytTR family DNA-binding domain-containing protein n=1 Tax=Streptococcus dentapri TaxID=573564 RepID=A0ABV8D384_9STRE